ncbi:MAG TPA: bifunctional isocitrate dehydrogenase kinase/phosphatase [Thermoanaerobaculia bacterium]|nr:bifunctional isocitrate dehydrogenase kinase/phosphatase [Thermoanaerobaculia bacterium]
MDLSTAATRGADTIHWAFDDFHQRVRAVTHRVRQRFERCDWIGIRQDTVERLGLHGRSIAHTCDALHEQLGDQLTERKVWGALKEAYHQAILGRNDYELALTFFNSLTRKVFAHSGVDPSIDFVAEDIPLPYRGWEMASARMYAVRSVEPLVVRRVLDDAGFRVPFRDLETDSREAAAHIERGLREVLGGAEIVALDVLRPVFFRNKAAYVIGRARGEKRVVPVILAVVAEEGGLSVDAVLTTEAEASVVFSFARWYFHAEVESPREVIGFLRSLLPRKRISELYNSLGYGNHGKTELYRDLVAQIAASDDPFVVAPGKRGLVMEVFTLPSFEFVFKVIRDRFPPQKATTRDKIMEKYRQVLQHDRVGRLVDFQEFEHLTFPRSRFDPTLLDELLRVAGSTVVVQGDDVIVRHLYVQRRVTPLDIYLRKEPAEAAEAAVLDWGLCLKDLAAADIFPGDILLKNFGVTRHGRVVFYDYDEFSPLVDCTFRRVPAARNEQDEMSAEPWYSVAERDVFPEELQRFLGFDGHLREVFEREHGNLFDPAYWRSVQERNRSGELIDFFPYAEARRLRGSSLR